MPTSCLRRSREYWRHRWLSETDEADGAEGGGVARGANRTSPVVVPKDCRAQIEPRTEFPWRLHRGAHQSEISLLESTRRTMVRSSSTCCCICAMRFIWRSRYR